MPAIGLFGKLPAVGDFVSRGFSNELRENLDKMIQSALMAAYAEGATRESLQSSAPGLVVNIRPGTLCRTGFLGTISPSCDRVGRFYPMCLGLETDPAPEPWALSWVPLRLSTLLLQLAYEAHTQLSSPDELYGRLPDAAALAQMALVDQPFSSALDITLPSLTVTTTQFAFEGPEQQMAPNDQAMCLRLPMLAELLGGVVNSGDGFDLFFATRSLLTWSSLAALFDGRWQHWTWSFQACLEADEDADATTLPPRVEESDDAEPPFMKPED